MPPKPSITEGSVWSTNNCGRIEVTKYINAHNIWVQFLDTGALKSTDAKSIKNGNVKDHLIPTTAGIGFFGYGKYKMRNLEGNQGAYDCWRSMLRRCYEKNNRSYHRYGGSGVTVCKDWHNFQNFAEWYYKNYKKGFQIDKDILSTGIKIYSPEKCRFVPHKINVLLTSSAATRGEYPLGVHLDRESGRYAAKVSNTEGGETFLGYHNCPEDAFLAYKTEKEKIIKRVAKQEYERGNIDRCVFEALTQWEIKE